MSTLSYDEFDFERRGRHDSAAKDLRSAPRYWTGRKSAAFLCFGSLALTKTSRTFPKSRQLGSKFTGSIIIARTERNTKTGRQRGWIRTCSGLSRWTVMSKLTEAWL